MSKMLPSGRPNLKKEQALELLGDWDFYTYPIAILGIRGYYENSMGKPAVNDIGIYDDACCVITKDKFRTFNFNTDPSSMAEGRAMLDLGTWHSYMLGIHKTYRALIQRKAKVRVIRKDSRAPKGFRISWGFFGINIHKGGINTTGSLGCQTIPPSQWDEFIYLIESSQKTVGREDGLISYKLIQN